MNEIKRRPGARRPGTPDGTVQRTTTADGRTERPSAQRPSVQARPRPQSHISEQQSSAAVHTERNENTQVTERRRASRPMPSSFRAPQPEREAVHPRPQHISRTVPAPAVTEQSRPEPQKKEYPENVPPSFQPFGRADIEAILKQESSHHTVKTPERKPVLEQEHRKTEVNEVRHTETDFPSVPEQPVQSQTEEKKQPVPETAPVIERDAKNPLQATRLIRVFAKKTAEQMTEQKKTESSVSEGGHAIIFPLEEEEKKQEDINGEDLYAQFASEAPATMTGSMPVMPDPSDKKTDTAESVPPAEEKAADEKNSVPEKSRWKFGRKKKEDDGETEEKKPEPGSKKKSFLKWLLVFVMILGMFVGLKKTGVLAAESVIGTSMEPNYHTRDIVYSTNIRDIKRYDVVVADSPTGIKVIKRVIGLPGDTITYKNRHVYVNGTLTDESFINGGAEIELNLSGKIELGDDEYFVCGDNRENSSDSRIYGAITRSDIFGIVLVRIPLSGQF